jgi:diketogulonate reductase-like aldo/keto reductase
MPGPKHPTSSHRRHAGRAAAVVGRRGALRAVAGLGLAAALPNRPRAEAAGMLARPIPATGEPLPAVGLGSWATFNVGEDAALREECAAVMRAFFEAGGRLIDSSPMYGSSQPAIGYGLERLGRPPDLFSAEKVWISDGEDGPAQIEQSRRYWGVPRFDLMQVHNLRAWEEHLPTLYAMKAAGELRYVGITTSDGRRHEAFEAVMRAEPLDFIQVTYNILDREADERILPLAAERGMAVLANRPFRRGALIEALEDEPLPPWAGEIGCASWPQFLLKFIISHPAITCAIPATSRVDHLVENMAAGRGPMPDAGMRARMIDYVESL